MTDANKDGIFVSKGSFYENNQKYDYKIYINRTEQEIYLDKWEFDTLIKLYSCVNLLEDEDS